MCHAFAPDPSPALRAPSPRGGEGRQAPRHLTNGPSAQYDSVILTLSYPRYNTVMKTGELGLLTIEELSARVAEALSVGYEGVASSRVRDVPDLRTIRYYTTLGLLDRPAAMRGRTALYGPRHLLQLVAIKHLQAQGLSLAAVQERVVGLSDRALRKIVERTSRKPSVEPKAPRRDGDNDSNTHRPSFWRLANSRPAFHQNAAASSALPEPAPAQIQEAPSKAAGADYQTIVLGEGVLLSLCCRREVDREDLRSIRAAAAALVEILKLRGLIDKAIDSEANT